MKLVKAILLVCLVAALQAHKIAPLASHAETVDPLWAHNCDGDVKKRIEDIKNFQMVARMTEELAKEVQEGLEWLQTNCLIANETNPNLNCLGNVMERIKTLENTLMTSRFVESVRKPLEEELAYLKDVCQGKCPQNPAKAIADLEAEMMVSLYTAEMAAELQNRLQFWKEVCLKQVCPKSKEEIVKQIKSLEFKINNSDANEAVLDQMRQEVERLKACLKKPCSGCDKLKKSLEMLNKVEQEKIARVKALNEKAIERAKARLAQAQKTADRLKTKIEKEFEEKAAKLKEALKQACSDDSTCH